MAELLGMSAASRRSERAAERRLALPDLPVGATEGMLLGPAVGASDFPLFDPDPDPHEPAAAASIDPDPEPHEPAAMAELSGISAVSRRSERAAVQDFEREPPEPEPEPAPDLPDLPDGIMEGVEVG